MERRPFQETPPQSFASGDLHRHDGASGSAKGTLMMMMIDAPLKAAVLEPGQADQLRCYRLRRAWSRTFADIMYISNTLTLFYVRREEGDVLTRISNMRIYGVMDLLALSC